MFMKGMGEMEKCNKCGSTEFVSDMNENLYCKKCGTPKSKPAKQKQQSLASD